MTDAKNTAEDWGHIMDLCDQVQQHKNGSKECLKAIVKRLNHQDPHVVLQAVTVSGLHCIISYHESFTYIVEVSCFNILEYLIPLFKRNEQNSATIVNLQCSGRMEIVVALLLKNSSIYFDSRVIT